MAKITDLATELLQQIWSLIPIEDIDQLSLSCQIIYRAGSKCINEHKALKRKYSLVKNWSKVPTNLLGSRKQPTQSTGVSLLSALCAIDKEPIIAEYVDEIDLDRLCNDWSESPDEQELARFGATVAALDTLEQLIARCPYLFIGPRPSTGRSMTSGWTEEIQWGSEDPILSLLLTMLPKVRTFRLRGDVHLLWLETISQIAADPTAVALSHLNLIDLNLDSRTQKPGFRMLAALARVPSLTTLQVKNAYEPRHEEIEYLRLQANTSNVAELSLMNQHTCSVSLGAFLGIFRALRRFVYKPCDPPDLEGLESVMLDFYPSEIVTVLLEHAGNTLEHLTLYAGSRRLTWMGPLTGFSALTSVRTDWQLLVDGASSSQTLLADNLPVSIQHLELNVDPSFGLEAGTALIRHLVSTRETRFPSLTSIKFLHMSEENARGLLDKSFVAEAKDIGMTIDCDVSENPDTTSRALLEARKAYDIDDRNLTIADGTIARFFRRPGGLLV